MNMYVARRGLFEQPPPLFNSKDEKDRHIYEKMKTTANPSKFWYNWKREAHSDYVHEKGKRDEKRNLCRWAQVHGRGTWG